MKSRKSKKNTKLYLFYKFFNTKLVNRLVFYYGLNMKKLKILNLKLKDYVSN